MNTAHLDWRDHTVGPAKPCRICHRRALMRDANGLPCHKTCAEQATSTVTEPDRDALVIDLDSQRAPARHLPRSA